MIDEIGAKEREYDFAVRWWQRFHDCPPQISMETTERMIRSNVITPAEAFKAVLPMGTGTYRNARISFLNQGQLQNVGVSV